LVVAAGGAMEQIDRERLVRAYPVLRELPSGSWGRVEQTGEAVRMPAGRRLFGEGAACAHFPFLLEGTIRASKLNPEGHQILLYRLESGEACVLTVLALLAEAAYVATATAETTLLDTPDAGRRRRSGPRPERTALRGSR
jgi:CRP/FNR family transcriptional regulator